MRLHPLLLLLTCFLAASGAAADDHVVAPVGEYATIDVRLTNATLETLLRGSEQDRTAAIEAILRTPEKYAPPVFFALSHVLFNQGRKDDGAFWFYAGQLRARFDANRCADVSARQAVGVLTEEFGPPINQYMFKDFTKVEALIPRVLEWDRKTPHEYDHRWINLHGMEAMMESLDASGKPKALSLPRADWDAIAEKTRADYRDGFEKAKAMMKERAAAVPPAPSVPAKPGWERQLAGTWKQELSSVLLHFPQSLPGMAPGEKGREAAAERFRLEWVVTPDTIAVVNPMVAAERRQPPFHYRVASVEGNLATLAVTPSEGAAFAWTIESREPDLIRVLHGGEEIYTLRRVAAPARPR